MTTAALPTLQLPPMRPIDVWRADAASKLTRSASQVLNVLVTLTDNETRNPNRPAAYCYLAKATGRSLSSAFRAVRQLVAKGFVVRHRRHSETGANLPNLYQVVADVSPELKATVEAGQAQFPAAQIWKRPSVEPNAAVTTNASPYEARLKRAEIDKAWQLIKNIHVLVLDDQFPERVFNEPGSRIHNYEDAAKVVLALKKLAADQQLLNVEQARSDPWDYVVRWVLNRWTKNPGRDNYLRRELWPLRNLHSDINNLVEACAAHIRNRAKAPAAEDEPASARPGVPITAEARAALAAALGTGPPSSAPPTRRFLRP